MRSHDELLAQAELLIERVPGENGRPLPVESSTHLMLRVLAQDAEAPLHIGRDRDPPRARLGIRDAQQGDLDRFVTGHSHREKRRESVVRMLERRSASAVANHEWRGKLEPCHRSEYFPAFQRVPIRIALFHGCRKGLDDRKRWNLPDR
jgi:hypothetical protein